MSGLLYEIHVMNFLILWQNNIGYKNAKYFTHHAKQPITISHLGKSLTFNAKFSSHLRDCDYTSCLRPHHKGLYLVRCYTQFVWYIPVEGTNLINLPMPQWLTPCHSTAHMKSVDQYPEKGYHFELNSDTIGMLIFCPATKCLVICIWTYWHFFSISMTTVLPAEMWICTFIKHCVQRLSFY